MSLSTLHPAGDGPEHHGGKPFLRDKSGFADKPFYATRLYSWLNERYPNTSYVLVAAKMGINVSEIVNLPGDEVPDFNNQPKYQLHLFQESLGILASDMYKSSYTGNCGAPHKVKLRTTLMTRVQQQVFAIIQNSVSDQFVHLLLKEEHTQYPATNAWLALMKYCNVSTEASKALNMAEAFSLIPTV